MPQPPGSISNVSQALARDRLGVPAVVFFVLSGVAPETVAAGVITTAYAVTGLTSVPAAFLVVAVILGLFSVGYVAMARHITNAGAFYAFIARGLGRPAGVSAALVALVAYNLLQVALYGAFGPNMASFMAEHLDLHAAWWAWALMAWASVTVLGLLRVDLNGKVLAVLLSAEIVVVTALAISGLTQPQNGVLSLATLSPTKLMSGGVGAALVIAVLGYVGFEQSAIFAEEARNPRRTVRVATYFSLGLIAVVYAGASWALAVHNGDGQVVQAAQQQGPELLFTMGRGILADAGRTLFLTSLFAAALAFHNAVWRYMFALGRESVLPAVLGRTGRNNVPKLASAVQSGIGLCAILVFAFMHWNPMVNLFFWLGTTGGFGILLLIAATSVAVMRFFARAPYGESVWRRAVAPFIAAVALIGMLGLAVANYATLLGVAPNSPWAIVLPVLFGVTAVLGIAWALVLRTWRPEVYQAIGLGASATVAEVASFHLPPLPPPIVRPYQEEATP